jgi:hypothetical protein
MQPWGTKSGGGGSQPMSTKGVKSNQGRNLLKLDAACSVKRENLVFDGG